MYKELIIRMLREYYKKSWHIIRQNRKIIFALTALYILFLVGGLIYNSMTYTKFSFSSEESKAAYQEFFKTTNFKDTFIGNFQHIFFHNAIASLFRIATGIILAIIPLWLIINDGILDSAAIINSGYNILFSFIPHGIFEIPAMIISSSLGVMIFLSILKSKNRRKNIIQAYKNTFLIFLLIIIPLLLIAGIIEALEIMILFFW
mgnify:CR=1 FL=1